MGADLCPSDLLGLLVTGKARTELWEEEGDGTVREDSSGSEGVLPTSAPLPLYARNRKKPGSGSLFQFGLSPGEALPGQGRVFCRGWGVGWDLFSPRAGSLLACAGPRQLQKEDLGVEGIRTGPGVGSLQITGHHP